MDTTIREALEAINKIVQRAHDLLNEAYAEAESKYPYRDTHHAHREIIDEKRDAYASALISERKRAALTSLSAATQGVVEAGDAIVEHVTEFRRQLSKNVANDMTDPSPELYALMVKVLHDHEGKWFRLFAQWDAAKSSTEPDSDMVEAGVANTLENAVKFLHRANTVAGEHGVPKDQIVSYASAMVHWGNEIRDRASTPNQTPANNTDYLDSIMKEVEEWGKCPTCDGEGYFGEESCEQCHFVGHILPELDDLRTRLTPLFRKDASVSLRKGEYGKLQKRVRAGFQAFGTIDIQNQINGTMSHETVKVFYRPDIYVIDTPKGWIVLHNGQDFISECTRLGLQYILITPEP